MLLQITIYYIYISIANITFFGIFGYIRVRGVCHRDEWGTVGAIDCSSGAAAGGWSSSFGWSIIFCQRVRGTSTTIFNIYGSWGITDVASLIAGKHCPKQAVTLFGLLISLCISYFASTGVVDLLGWYSYMLGHPRRTTGPWNVQPNKNPRATHVRPIAGPCAAMCSPGDQCADTPRQPTDTPRTPHKHSCCSAPDA